jgi:hypothetical protein
MKIEIPTAEMNMGDGAVMRLLLCKDAEKLNQCLAHLERVDIGDDLYLAYTTDLRHRIVSKDLSQEKRINAKCRLCHQPVYHWTNEFQQRVWCGCTIWILPLDASGIEEIDNLFWADTVKTALRGIKEWLRQS